MIWESYHAGSVCAQITYAVRSELPGRQDSHCSATAESVGRPGMMFWHCWGVARELVACWERGRRRTQRLSTQHRAETWMAGAKRGADEIDCQSPKSGSVGLSGPTGMSCCWHPTEVGRGIGGGAWVCAGYSTACVGNVRSTRQHSAADQLLLAALDRIDAAATVIDQIQPYQK